MINNFKFPKAPLGFTSKEESSLYMGTWVCKHERKHLLEWDTLSTIQIYVLLLVFLGKRR